ncbi:Phosphate-repressible phosphate permease pho-4 [Porphyridium purpureum]|uniref:Phosphate transporter n=1 Tax=Porphyridium purpureum TaxID=35688 RepID=A0A5J4Z5N0_PORPP|nr:Phosphate-repressible phosphate permease pho-4 [Porphyridium purpureum]|eukprot:POR3433..scf295_1
MSAASGGAVAVVRDFLEYPTPAPWSPPPGEAVWPLDGTSFALLDSAQVTTTDFYLWLVVITGIAMFITAWGIGANDVANAFATSVGAGSVSLKMACVVAAVMEFLGALLLGSRVSSTIRKGILNVDYFDPTNREKGALNGPEVLMIGNFITLLSAGSWLITATFLELPVSTTHTIVGAYIGIGLAYRGVDAVVWISEGSGFEKLQGVVGIFISWFVSPVAAGLISVTFFLLVRRFVLRADNPVRNGLLFAPLFYGLVAFLIVFFVLWEQAEELRAWNALIGLGAAIVVMAMTWFILVPYQKKRLNQWEERQILEIKNPDLVSTRHRQDQVSNYLQRIGLHVSLDPEADVQQDSEVQERHARAEVFDPKAEHVFSWLQVATAAFDSFSHGANDVANAVAPFTTVLQLYQDGGNLSRRTVSSFSSSVTLTGGGALNGTVVANGAPIPNGQAYCGEIGGVEYWQCVVEFGYLTGQTSSAQNATFSLYSETGSFAGDSTCYSDCNPGCFATYSSAFIRIPVWVLAIGGIGITVGLAAWGYKVILALGKKLTKITASRGFCIEFGASITVLVAAALGIPVSTTHCQVGATVGVGLADGRINSVHWKQFASIFAGWVITLLICALSSAGLFILCVLSPYKFAVPQSLSYCAGQQLFWYDDASDAFRGFVCSGLTG